MSNTSRWYVKQIYAKTGVKRQYPHAFEDYGTYLKVIPFSCEGTRFSHIYPLSMASGGLSHQFWGETNHLMPINMRIGVSEDKEITDSRGQLFAAQAEFRKAQAALRRAHEILDTPVDGTHSLKLALEQQIRAIQRMADMLKKVGERLEKEKNG